MKSVITGLVISVMMVSAAGAVPVPVSVESLYGRLWGGLGILSGDVTYQIGGAATNPVVQYWFPVSELRWPLNVPVVTLGGDIPLGHYWEMSGELSKNLSAGTGKMKDSDWTDASDTRLKTVYSESDTALSSIAIDAAVRRWLSRENVGGDVTLGIALGGGLLYERFDWDASNVDQWYPPDPGRAHDRVGGLVGTYQATVTMPYVEMAAELAGADRWTILVRGGFSPFTAVSDEDDHMLRQIRATADLSGSAYKVSLEGQCALSQNWVLSARGSMVTFDILGTENDFVYGNINNDYGDSWTIEHKTSSTHYTLSLTAGCRF